MLNSPVKQCLPVQVKLLAAALAVEGHEGRAQLHAIRAYTKSITKSLAIAYPSKAVESAFKLGYRVAFDPKATGGAKYDRMVAVATATAAEFLLV